MKPYNLSREDKIIAEKEINIWIDNKFAEFSKPDDLIAHASPMFIVNRHLGEGIFDSRIVIDNTALNNNSFGWTFNGNCIDDVLMYLSDSILINKTDLKKYFYHFEIEKSSQKYTFINTHLGLIKMKRMCHGLKTAPLLGHYITTNIFPPSMAIQDDIYTKVTLIDYLESNNAKSILNKYNIPILNNFEYKSPIIKYTARKNDMLNDIKDDEIKLNLNKYNVF